MSKPLFIRQLLVAGARDTIPMLVGAAPFGVIFGSLAMSAGLPVWAVLLMSLWVFAGSSQFIAIGLLGAGAAMPVIWLTTLVVNLRHALYSASLMRFVRHLSWRWRLALSFWLTDETYAVVQHHYANAENAAHGHWYYLGSCLAMYGNWFFWTVIGVVFGAAFPQLGGWGLDFAMVATFVGIVAPLLRNWPMVATAVVAGGVALIGAHWPYKLGLMAAAGGGVATGMLLSRLLQRGAP